jgi:hypothetical protein
VALGITATPHAMNLFVDAQPSRAEVPRKPSALSQMREALDMVITVHMSEDLWRQNSESLAKREDSRYTRGYTETICRRPSEA